MTKTLKPEWRVVIWKRSEVEGRNRWEELHRQDVRADNPVDAMKATKKIDTSKKWDYELHTPEYKAMGPGFHEFRRGEHTIHVHQLNLCPRCREVDDERTREKPGNECAKCYEVTRVNHLCDELKGFGVSFDEMKAFLARPEVQAAQVTHLTAVIAAIKSRKMSAGEALAMHAKELPPPAPIQAPKPKEEPAKKATTRQRKDVDD